MTPWPTQLPISDSLAILKEFALTRNVKDIPKLANCGWVATGYLLGLKFPLQDKPVVGMAAAVPPASASKPPFPVDESDHVGVDVEPFTVEEAISAIEAGEDPQLKSFSPLIVIRLALLLIKLAKDLRIL